MGIGIGLGHELEETNFMDITKDKRINLGLHRFLLHPLTINKFVYVLFLLTFIHDILLPRVGLSV